MTSSTEVVPAAHSALLLPAAGVEEIKGAMQAYQATLDAVLDRTDWQGRPGADGSFVKKSGWLKIAKAFGLSTEMLSESVKYADDGTPVSAKAVCRALAPNGQHADASGACSVDEPRFERAKGRQKLLNDLSGTAATRACNRAISNLVGYGKVSAEEMSEPPAPADYGAASTELVDKAIICLEEILVGIDAASFLDVLNNRYGGNGVPEPAVQALVGLHWYVVTRAVSDPEPTPVDVAETIVETFDAADVAS